MLDDDDEQAFQNILPEADAVDANVCLINHQYVADLLINSEVLIPKGETHQMAKVIRRAIDTYGNIIGTFD